MIIICKKCGKERIANLSKVNIETYKKQYPNCRHCSFNNLSSKGWFKKGLKVWNKGKKGIHLSPSTEFKKGIRNSPQTEFKKGQLDGKENFNWKGDKVGYYALHAWVQRQLGKAKICIYCGSSKKVQWANKSWQYKRDTNDWLELCFRCHRKYDKQNWGIATQKFPELK